MLGNIIYELSEIIERYINRRICGVIGHDFEDFADGENGRGVLECKRCGECQTYQW